MIHHGIHQFYLITNSNPHYGKAPPEKIDYERLSKYFVFRLHDIVRYALQKTTQLAQSVIDYPM
jgi:hypothetical protein